jgi:hypothetical protein
MMVYDDAKGVLVVVEGAIDGKQPTPKMWDFSLPFGLGLAGACFKEGEQAFLYVRPQEPSVGPELYIPRSEDDIHEVLLALPIDHPGFANYLASNDLGHPERSRQCIGIINIGSRARTTNLGKVRTKTSVISVVSDLCQDFCNRAMIPAL